VDANGVLADAKGVLENLPRTWLCKAKGEVRTEGKQANAYAGARPASNASILPSSRVSSMGLVS
jgi:hypothetical protein